MTSGLMAPGAPATPTAVAGNGQATVTIARGPTGGAPASYTVTAAPGGSTCTVTVPATSCSVKGLRNRTAYTFTTTATNATATSSPSSTSAAVTPRGQLVVRAHATDTAIVSTFTVAGAGTVIQRATRASAQSRAARITICSTKRTIAKAGRVTVTCQLTAATQRLRLGGAVHVTLATTLTLDDGTKISSTKVMVLPKTHRPAPVPSTPNAVTG
jgi:hypothetical protein